MARRERDRSQRSGSVVVKTVRRSAMAIVLDHTIVPAKDKMVAAKFFAEIFGLQVKPGQGYSQALARAATSAGRTR